MQSQSENTNISRDKLWSEEEIKQLILYAKDMQGQVEDMKANIIMMDAKLKNEEAKVRDLQQKLYFLSQAFTNNTIKN